MNMINKETKIKYPCREYGFYLPLLSEKEKKRYTKSIYHYNNAPDKSEVLKINTDLAEEFLLKSAIEFMEMITYDNLDGDFWHNMNKSENNHHHKRFYLLPEIKKDLKKFNMNLIRANTKGEEYDSTKINRYNIFTKIKPKKKWDLEEIKSITKNTLDKANNKNSLTKLDIKENNISTIGLDLTTITDVAISDIGYKFGLTKLEEVNNVYSQLLNGDNKGSLYQAIKKSMIEVNTERNLYLGIMEIVEMEIFTDMFRYIIKNKLPEALSIYGNRTNLINALLEKAEILYEDYVSIMLLRDNEFENFLDTEMLTACVYRIYEIKDYLKEVDVYDGRVRLFIKNVNLLSKKILDDLNEGKNIDNIISSFDKIIKLMEEKCEYFNIDINEIFLSEFNFSNMNDKRILFEKDYSVDISLQIKRYTENIENIRGIRHSLNAINSKLKITPETIHLKKVIAKFNNRFPDDINIVKELEENFASNNIGMNWNQNIENNFNVSIELDNGVFCCFKKIKHFVGNVEQADNFTKILNSLSKVFLGGNISFVDKTRSGGLNVIEIKGSNILDDNESKKIKLLIENLLIEVEKFNMEKYHNGLRNFLSKNKRDVERTINIIRDVEVNDHLTVSQSANMIAQICDISSRILRMKEVSNLFNARGENYREHVMLITNRIKEKNLVALLDEVEKVKEEPMRKRKI